MPSFRIHRMKDGPRQQFRWAPHVSGMANVKPKDYEPSGETEAENEYAAWALLRNSGKPLGVGDILELLPERELLPDGEPQLPSGPLRICKYVGFEEARWVVPETSRNGLDRQDPERQNMVLPEPAHAAGNARA